MAIWVLAVALRSFLGLVVDVGALSIEGLCLVLEGGWRSGVNTG